MYTVYLFREKVTGKVIYVGSSARPSARMKEHLQILDERKPNNQKIYDYMRNNGLKFYKDVEVIWVDCADNKEEMYELEAQYYYKYQDTVMNDRPAEIRDGKYNPKRRKVRCINTGEIFNTVTECASYFHKGRNTITRVLNKVHEYTYINDEKYYFEYVNGTCNDYSERKYTQASGYRGYSEMNKDIV